MRDVFTLTAREATGKARYNLRLTDNRAIRIMREHDIVWMRGHYQDKLHGQFKSAVDEVMRTGYSRGKLATELAGRLGGIVEGDASYFSDLADHTVTKAREIGRIAGFEEAGITEVRVRAVLDDRTSPVCRALNGRIIEIRHLTAQRDEILAAKTIDQLKSAAAWSAPYLGPSDALPKGVGIPPYHYRCRTTLMAVVNKAKVDAVKGAQMTPRDEAIIAHFKVQEHVTRAKEFRDAAGTLPYAPKLIRGDVVKSDDIEKHGKKFGIDVANDERGKPIVTEEDKSRYLDVARRAISNSRDVVVKVHRPTSHADPIIQYHYYDPDGAEVAIDQLGQIRNCDWFNSKHYEKRVVNRSGDGLWIKHLLSN